MITEPVVPTQAPQPTSSVSRRQVAVIAAVAVLAAAIGLVLGLSVMQGRGSSLAPAAGYVPSGSLMYMEADLSLSASQEDALRAILARFPGTDPDAVSGDGLAEALDEALDQADAPLRLHQRHRALVRGNRGRDRARPAARPVQRPTAGDRRAAGRQ